ncbi:MAG TPA: gamma-glutamyl-gamma-aminobutyrate hydrolase family protein, partial [Acidimicrobiales bacterium]|nr:gamma-glutamyl-gamma-aminobutyrate hydrolase family protein [Acidimicrobiales bacterium]
MSAPLIGLSGRRWPATALGAHVPPAMHAMEFDLHFADYPQAVAACGGLPVELARDADVEGVVARIDGLVLTGGADVDPAVYGHAPDANLGTTEPARDAWELALLAAAEQRDLPVLCVCRGAQLLNVAKG